MPHEYMLTVEELDRMEDLSAATLYHAEVRRIPLLPRDGQSEYVEAAREGDETALQRLVLNCLNWTMRRADAIYRDKEPAHSDMMDLVGHANMKMVEAMPKALTAKDPVAYCMTVGALAMSWYCLYNDPLVQRKRDQPLNAPHPGTVSLENNDVPVSHEVSPQDAPEYKIIYDALAQLGKRHQIVLMAAYGLHGETKRSNEEIAIMLNLPKGTVEKYLWRAKRRLAAKLAPYVTEKGLSAE